MTVVLVSQGEVEVFVNESGGVIIRQACRFGGDDDVVVIAPECVDTLCSALRKAKSDALAARVKK